MKMWLVGGLVVVDSIAASNSSLRNCGISKGSRFLLPKKYLQVHGGLQYHFCLVAFVECQPSSFSAPASKASAYSAVIFKGFL